jgi:chromosomal replication initiator protein
VKLHAANAFVAKWLQEKVVGKIQEAAAPVIGVAAEDVPLDIDVESGTEERVASPSGGEPSPKGDGTGRPKSLPIAMHPVSLPGRFVDWRYRFEDFVVGDSNRMAVAAAEDMTRHGGTVQTLFVNSSSGLGKTHLSQALGRAIDEEGAGVRIVYLTAEDFASRFVSAMKRKDVDGFKNSFRDMDVIILEDVHFFQSKPKMQEMALGVVKRLQSRGGRVVFTSSFSARELQGVDSQLVSHFCSGILARMDQPGLDMRKEILQRKARNHQVHLPEPVCDVLASRLEGDVRQMESCLDSLVFKARLLKQGVSVELAMDVLSAYAGETSAAILPAIVRLVCEGMGVTEEDLRSRSRRQEFVHGRNSVFYLARKHTDRSLREIGELFNRTHATVIKGITSLEQEITRDSTVGRRLAANLALVERNAGLVKGGPSGDNSRI